MLNHLKLKHSSDISGWFTPEKHLQIHHDLYSVFFIFTSNIGDRGSIYVIY
jgi:hypothetical protein